MIALALRLYLSSLQFMKTRGVIFTKPPVFKLTILLINSNTHKIVTLIYLFGTKIKL